MLKLRTQAAILLHVFISFALLAFLVGPRPLGAQPGKPRVVGYLTPAPPGVVSFHQFRQALRDIGYVDGQDILVEERSAGGDLSRLPHLAAELVSMRVDIIVAVANEAIRAAKDATATIPILMRFSTDDPVINGFVKSYQHPGGNVTGLTIFASELGAKRMELLKQLIPGLGRIAVLVNPARAWYHLRETQAAARSLGVQLYVVTAQDPGDYPAAFASMMRERVQAVYVTPDPVFLSHRKLLIELADKHRLPALHDWREVAEAGGLITYGPNLLDLNRRAAHYVDRILKGSKPGDLPIERPTKFELVINLKAARAIGLTIPPSLLLRADQVIE